SRASVLVTQRHLEGRVPPSGLRVIEADGSLATVPPGWAPAKPDPLSAVYVIYTSGSTGRPKGVVNNHAGPLNRLHWLQQALPPGDTESVLQKTSFSFDVSVWEFFWPLIVGARIVVAKPDGHRDSAYLVDLIRQENVAILHFVPSMLQPFVAEPGVTEC